MPEQDIQALADLTRLVLWAAFGLAMALGALGRYSNFCALGAVADVISMEDWTRARMWLLSVGTAMIGFSSLVGAGWIDPANSFYTAPRLLWLSNSLGGLMFGFGMALASGCGGRALVRLGGGNLKSLVVLVVMAVAAFATMRGITAVWRVATLDQLQLELVNGQDLPALLAGDDQNAQQADGLWLGLLLGGVICAWALASDQARNLRVVLGGVGIGLAVTGLWWVSGVLGYVPEHPETLEQAFLATASRGMESFSFVAPLAQLLDWLLFYSDKSKSLTLGAVLVLGVPLGSLAVAAFTGSQRWEGFRDAGDLGHHLVGAVLMGVGGVTAVGCTFGQGISGLSTLALGSLLTSLGLVAGAVAGLRYQLWRME